jgi:hypothetical protein
MNRPDSKQVEKQLRAAARTMKYPRTPDVSRTVRIKLMRLHPNRTRLILRAAAITTVILLVLALAVPKVRAQLAGFFQVGVIRIFPYQFPTATAFAEAPVTATSAKVVSTPIPTVTAATPTADNTPLALRGLAGRTTLEDAQILTGFRIRLPAYPTDLGIPDYVFYQDQIKALVLAWRGPGNSKLVRLSLYEFLSTSIFVNKFEPVIVKETTVNGIHAIWAEGPYLVQVTNGNYESRSIVTGYSLIWEQAGVTYRLETDLPLEEAVKIAESLK